MCQISKSRSADVYNHEILLPVEGKLGKRSALTMSVVSELLVPIDLHVEEKAGDLLDIGELPDVHVQGRLKFRIPGT